MNARKPIDEACTGGVFCPVDGHVTGRRYSNGNAHVSHIPLTRGQSKTLRERRRAESAMPKDLEGDEIGAPEHPSKRRTKETVDHG